MAYRLLIRLGDGVHRHGLADGEHLLGSDPEAAVRVLHPTVSRRHARLTVVSDELIVEDLGSRNGTRVDGVEVEEPVAVSPGARLQVGNVGIRVASAEAGDLDVGIALDDPPEARVEGAAPSTIGPGALEVFALKDLPRRLDSLVAGEEPDDAARSLGAALYRDLPCLRVEVVCEVGGEPAVLFEAERDSPDSSGRDEAIVSAEAGDGVRFRVEFLHPSMARTYGPLVTIAAGLVRLARSSRRERPRPSGAGTVVGSSAERPRPASVVPRMRRLYDEARRVAASRVSVLIRGESGTGKELLARYLHAASDRREAPLVTLNCAALPRELLEAELFGVERGVATGVEARPGKFESADGGTLFLDEVGDMALETQARILRVLQEGEVYRVGSRIARSVDLRVLSATNRDVEALLESGRFRRDLYHRIADWVVELPSLRERRADIPNLAAHFLQRAGRERGVRPAGISRSAVDALLAYDWPGNVRQLEKEMERASLFLEDGELLDTERLQEEIREASRGREAGESLQVVREEAERTHIRRIVEDCGGHLPAAAERLHIGLSTLYGKLKSLGID